MDLLTIIVTIIGIVVAAAIPFYLSYRAGRTEVSHERFKQIRSEVKSGRARFQNEAMRVLGEEFPDRTQHNGVNLFALAGWIPPGPIPLDQLELTRMADPHADVTLRTRDLPRNMLNQYETYAQAISDLDKPDTFVNHGQYRLLEIRGNRLTFSDSEYHYFDKINLGDFLLYDLASCRAQGLSIRESQTFTFWRTLRQPRDSLILAGVSTLTLIHAGDHLRMLMHKRGVTETAYAMGTYHVIPAGEFQPSCQAPASFNEDFDLWKNMMREYAEEVGGMKEHDGRSAIPFDYSAEPFATLTRERAKGNIRPFYLGTGLDPITMQGEIMTVVVFREETFSKIFPNVLHQNAEGMVITERTRWGKPFTDSECAAYTEGNTLSCAKAILNLAWANRTMFETCLR